MDRAGVRARMAVRSRSDACAAGGIDTVAGGAPCTQYHCFSPSGFSM